MKNKSKKKSVMRTDWHETMVFFPHVVSQGHTRIDISGLELQRLAKALAPFLPTKTKK